MCSFVHWIKDVCKINITVKCGSIRPVGVDCLQLKLRDRVTTGTSSHPCHCCVLLCLYCIEYFCLTPLQFYLAEYSMFVLQEYLSWAASKQMLSMYCKLCHINYSLFSNDSNCGFVDNTDLRHYCLGSKSGGKRKQCMCSVNSCQQCWVLALCVTFVFCCSFITVILPLLVVSSNANGFCHSRLG